MRLGKFAAMVAIGCGMSLSANAAKAVVYAYDEFDGNTAGFATDAFDSGTIANGEYTSADASGTYRALATPIAETTTEVWYAVTLKVPAIPFDGYAEPVPAQGADSGQFMELGFQSQYGSSNTQAGWPYSPPFDGVDGTSYATLLTKYNLVTGDWEGYAGVGDGASIDTTQAPLRSGNIGFENQPLGSIYLSASMPFSMDRISLASTAAEALGQTTATPEPASLSMLALGGLVALRRRRAV